MYDELVKRLRSAESNYQETLDCLSDAADAIEELRRSEAVALEYGADEHNRRLALEQKPRWISVAERLPEKMQYVLVRYQNNDMAVACWFGGDEHIRFWRAMTDEGWETDCDSEPTHWMPLPEPPKEG